MAVLQTHRPFAGRQLTCPFIELDNNVKLVDPTRDALYDYDAAAQAEINSMKPWTKDPNYFKAVRISAVALIKMVMHARSGGSLEVMGLMQGYVSRHALMRQETVYSHDGRCRAY